MVATRSGCVKEKGEEEEEETREDQSLDPSSLPLSALLSFFLANNVARVDFHVWVPVRHSTAQAKVSVLTGAIDGLALAVAAHPGHVPVERVLPTGRELCAVVRRAMGRGRDSCKTEGDKGREFHG